MNKNIFFDGIQEELILKKKQISELVNHSGIKGKYFEEIVIDFLRDRVKGLKIGNGIITNFEKSTKQCDIIIYNEKIKSPIFKSGDLVVVEPESVKAVIEVKSEITTDEVKKTKALFSDVKSLISIPCYLFGFTTFRNIESLNQDMTPHYVCVLMQNNKFESEALHKFMKDLLSKCLINL